LMWLSKQRMGATVEQFLLARHSLIDLRLKEAVDSGKVTQIIEIAAGLSPRGVRFKKLYGNKVKYIEADLPDMALLKESIFVRNSNELFGSSEDRKPAVVAVDALTRTGALSLNSIMKQHLSPSEGIAIITEGLVNYFNETSLRTIWENIAWELKTFGAAGGVYLSDIHLRTLSDTSTGDGNPHARRTKIFMNLLSAFVQRSVHLHFSGSDAAQEALHRAGFASGVLLHAKDFLHEEPREGYFTSVGAETVQVIEAWV
jgi:O-methyltransferase involved in polyketide biosynthesis